MRMLKKGLGVLFIFIILTGLCSAAVFAGEDDVVSERVSFKELKKSFEERNKYKVSLGAFEDKKFDGCYGNQLTKESRDVYDCLVSEIENSKYGINDLGNEKITVAGQEYNVIYVDVPYDSLKEDDGLDFALYAVMAFDYDYPEVFWIDFNKVAFMYGRKSGRSWISIVYGANDENYYCDGYSSYEKVNEDLDTINKFYEDIKNKTEDIDVYSKLKVMNSVLVDRNEYNRYVYDSTVPIPDGKEAYHVSMAYDAYNDDDKYDKRIYECVSAFIYGNTDLKNELNPVCEGYARAFKVLCDKAGIECALASGGGHMWNYVKLPDDDKWYAIDVTWNDPIFNDTPSEEDVERNKYRYFLIGYKSLTEGGGEHNLSAHTEETEGVVYPAVSGLRYPEIETDDYDYYPESEWVLGDINKNHTVEADDASKLLDLILKGGLTDYHKKVGYVDKSKPYITASDAAVIFKMALDAEH